MKLYFQLFVLSFFSFIAYSQNNIESKNNKFLIYGKLNPDSKKLTGFLDIIYYNNSTSTLNEIYFNLWANSFKSKSTDFAKKLIEDNKTEIYFAKDKELGGYNSLKFSIDGKNLSTEYKDRNKVFVKVRLDKPLTPNDSVKMKIEYELKIPKCFYNFGYSGSQYNMSRWYPRPVVYENSEWVFDSVNTCDISYESPADYTVILSLPDYYVLASSGDLKNPKENAFIQKRINATINKEDIITITPYPITYKTIKYEAKNICNFVWFANPKFKIISDTVARKHLFIYFTDDKLYSVMPELKQKTSELFALYQSKIKKYPFSKLNIIISDNIVHEKIYTENIVFNSEKVLSNYPNIFSELLNGINKSLANSIIVNPYKYPWIYVGFLQFPVYNMLDSLYFLDKDKFSYIAPFNLTSTGFCMTNGLKPANLDFFKYENCTDLSHFAGCKTTLSFNYLENYLGKDLFNKIYSGFIEKYEYKNITPDDIRQYFEKKSKKDLTWFFDGMLGTANPFRYSIKNVKRNANSVSITIENKGKYKIPFETGTLHADSIIFIQMIDGFIGEKTIELPIHNAEKIKLDPKNLYYKTEGIKTETYIKKKYIKPANITFYEKYGPSNIILPFIGYNKSDGLMLGGFLSDLRNKHNIYSLTTLYGFGSKSLVGTGDYKYRVFKNHSKKIIEIGFEGRSFHRLKKDDFNLRYKRFSGIFNIINKDNSDKIKNKTGLKYSIIADETISSEGIEKYYRFINKIYYQGNKGNAILPVNYKVELEHQYYKHYKINQYLKIAGEIKTAYMYKHKRYFRLRLYGATYLYNNNKNSTATYSGTLSLIGYGQNDYGYEHYFIDRMGQTGFWSRQLMMSTGGFKTAVNNAYGLGQSNKYVLAANLVFDLPVKIFIKPFLDMGIYGYLPTVSEGYSNKFLYSSGFKFEIIKDYFSFYLPVLNSKEIEDIYKEGEGFFKRISFSVKLNFLNDIK